MTRVIAIANWKGGVGKTTTTVSLGAALASRGKRVLLVDLDPQGCVSDSLNTYPAENRGLAWVLVGNNEGRNRLPLKEILLKANGLTLAPAGEDMARSEMQLGLLPTTLGSESLKQALRPVLADYDFVLVDCPPSKAILTISALRAAGEVLVPVETQFLAYKKSLGFFDTLEDVRQGPNPELRVLGILPTKFERQRTSDRDILHKMEEKFGEKYRIFPPIPKSVRVAEAPISGTAVSEVDPEGNATFAYGRLADEVEAA